ncbi:hypothetical protein DPEC_G00363520 [Dallia pectoralis]|nr:hypothetical protein DPEC_G00363520 [Dallia pectoralis]
MAPVETTPMVQDRETTPMVQDRESQGRHAGPPFDHPGRGSAWNLAGVHAGAPAACRRGYTNLTTRAEWREHFCIGCTYDMEHMTVPYRGNLP